MSPAPQPAPRSSYRKVVMLGLSSSAVVGVIALVPGPDRAQVALVGLDVLSTVAAFVVGVNAAEYFQKAGNNDP